MRSSFIILTFAAACLLGSSLTSPIYAKRGIVGNALDLLLGTPPHDGYPAVYPPNYVPGHAAFIVYTLSQLILPEEENKIARGNVSREDVSSSKTSSGYSAVAGYMDEEHVVIEEALGGAEDDKAYAAGNSLKVLEAM
ncbi:uncharacterized protein RHIMIDRAFT_236063 [Rhizopus microsporus ATCC 52813]|uniref:Uncharacterized protein n=1 Tax=Rhizopus microsporus ATCC 52813 TaxID=1340429 RepID=A0A2G4SZ75_RHIZD|nr:uncharacterized protein RHIMIDRAFT_236063 [Rhizopus microsporus ATCC 52813]PHZ14072.1 hypothetical protein RHIMIDRAFT_236063 [Rhizopus microsporus ATCC 52813]